jgi:hypothetical protein
LPLKNINIPEEEQLEAISHGLPSLSKLIDYLRSRPELMKKHLHKEGDPRYHEFSVLEYDGIKYRVYKMDHDDPWDIREYEDFAEATVDYLVRTQKVMAD